MKKLFFILTAALAFAAVSCTEDNPSDNNGKDDGNAKALTTLDSKTSTWNVDKRLFDLAFSGEGVSVKTQLVGFDAELGSGKYKLVAEASAVAGDAVKEKTLLDNAAVSSGSVTVSKNDKKYTFTFALTPADGKEVSLTWSGDIEWPADPAPKTTLTKVLSAQANQVTVDNAPVEGQFTLTMNLATAGISSKQDESTGWQVVWTGEGGYLALDLYSTDKYLHEGIYKANTVGGTWGAGQFGIGYDTTIKYMGWNPETSQMEEMTYEAKNWGTCWWNVKDGAAVADHKITDGIVVVRKVEEGWQISWGKEYPTEILFEGAIETLTEPDPSDIVEPKLEITSGLTYTIEDQTASNYADAQNTPLSGVQLFRIQVYEESNYLAEFDLVVTEGTTDFTGTYTVASYPHENLTAGNGWGIPSWNFYGGCYYVIDSTIFYLPNDAKLKVTDTAGTLKFEFQGTVLNVDNANVEGGSLLLDNVAKAS